MPVDLPPRVRSVPKKKKKTNNTLHVCVLLHARCLSACQYDMVGPEGIVESHQITSDGKAGATEAVDCKWYIRAPPRSKVSDINLHTGTEQPLLFCLGVSFFFFFKTKGKSEPQTTNQRAKTETRFPEIRTSKLPNSTESLPPTN